MRVCVRLPVCVGGALMVFVGVFLNACGLAPGLEWAPTSRKGKKVEKKKVT